MSLGRIVECPYCNYPDCTADEVDIGVGSIQSGPYGCDWCNASEISPHISESDRATLTDLERQTGWHAPPDPNFVPYRKPR